MRFETHLFFLTLRLRKCFFNFWFCAYASVWPIPWLWRLAEVLSGPNSILQWKMKVRSPPVNKPPALCGFIGDSGLLSMFIAAQHNEFAMRWLYNGCRVTHRDLLSCLRLISMQIQVCYAVLLVSYVSLAEGRWGRMWAASPSWVQGYYSSVLMSLILSYPHDRASTAVLVTSV